MTEDIFLKILNDTATEAEKIVFFSSIENDRKKREDFYRYKNLYVQSSLNPDNYRRQQYEGFAKFRDQVQSVKTKRTVNLWLRYAAIFIVASTLGFMADYVLTHKDQPIIAQHIKYSSEKGSVSTIHLEDGSAIWLSSGTNLIMDKNKQGETIAQLDGEAYFDLIPNPARKFVVDLGHLKVRDIGTKFNIRAYKSEQTISASLVEGKIDLFKESEKSFMTVKPGEYIKFDKADKKIEVNQKDPSLITAWKEGKFVFIDQPLSEICVELENWYNAEIQIEDEKLASTRYTSVVKRSTTIEMVLKILSITDQIHYEITNKKEGKDIIKIRK
jgi:ferric-dicitrate binding protein FerR (iron transport regulator)